MSDRLPGRDGMGMPRRPMPPAPVPHGRSYAGYGRDGDIPAGMPGPRPREQAREQALPLATRVAPVAERGDVLRADPSQRSSRQSSGARPRRSTGRPRRALMGAKLVVLMMSMLAFGGTWFGWATLLNLGLTTADVIDGSSTGEQNILLVGMDTRTDAQGNPLSQSLLNQLHAGSGSDGGDNTDTMIVVHIPAGGGKATAISIPRDSYVSIAGGYGKHKINSAYTYGKNDAATQLRSQGVGGADLEVQSAQAGARTAIQTVQQLTGLTITHYAAVNLVGFYYISEAVGGVPVCLKAAAYDPYSGARFPAGPQVVSGSQALAFVRQRHGLPLGDIDRIKRQQVFLASMAKTVLSGGTLTDSTKLSNLIDAIKKAVVIDRNWDILGFAQQMQSMSAGNIQFVTIPIVSPTLSTPDDGDAVEVSPSQVRAFVHDIATRSAGSAPASAPPATSAGNNASITVDVRNGAGTAGLAATVLDALSAEGYARGTTANSASRAATSVHYAPGQESQGKQVAAALGPNVGMESDSDLPPGTVRVYVGGDYDTLSLRTNSQADSPTTSDTPPPITPNGQNCVN